MKNRLVKIPGYLALVCSKTGRVFDYLSGREITPRYNTAKGEKGYKKLRVRSELTSLREDFYVHRLAYAAKAGINPSTIPHGHQVDHIDQDIANNSFSNLQLLSVSAHKRKTAIERELKKQQAKIVRFPSTTAKKLKGIAA